LGLQTGCRSPRAGSCAEAGPESAVALARYTILVPAYYNDGTPVSEATLERFRQRLFTHFQGYTDAGRVRGTYRMADGTRAHDTSIVFWVALPTPQLGTLRAELAQLAAELGQESIYLEHGGAVEFVKPGAAP
jgi:hypothetical protein